MIFCYILLAACYSSFLLSLSQYFILSIHFDFRPCVPHHPSPLLFSHQHSCCIFSETATETVASSSFLAGPVGPHHVLGVSLLLVMYLISHSDLFPQSFEFQPTWWYGGKGDSCLLWQRTANLRCPKLRFPAKILFNLKAPIVSCRDTGNYPKHSKVNVSYLEFFFKSQLLELENPLEMILSILLITDEEAKIQRGVWNSTPTWVLGMSILHCKIIGTYWFNLSWRMYWIVVCINYHLDIAWNIIK